MGFTRIQMLKRWYKNNDNLFLRHKLGKYTPIEAALKYEIVNTDNYKQLMTMSVPHSEEDVLRDAAIDRDYLWGRMFKDHPDYKHPIACEPFIKMREEVQRNLLNTGNFILVIK